MHQELGSTLTPNLTRKKNPKPDLEFRIGVGYYRLIVGAVTCDILFVCVSRLVEHFRGIWGRCCDSVFGWVPCRRRVDAGRRLRGSALLRNSCMKALSKYFALQALVRFQTWSAVWDLARSQQLLAPVKAPLADDTSCGP